MTAWWLFAQENAGEGAQGSPFVFLMPLAVMAVLYFVMILLPDRKRDKKRQAELAGIKKNDRVVTIGGILGTVAFAKPGDDEVTLKVDEDKDVKIRVTRASIAKILSAKDKEPAE